MGIAFADNEELKGFGNVLLSGGAGVFVNVVPEFVEDHGGP